jgi:hypothetical protein
MKSLDQILLEQAYEKTQEVSSEGFDSLLSELNKGIPGPQIFSLLQKVKQENKIRELIDHLNDLGNQDEQKWYLKDNLIKALFMGLTKEEM